MHAYFELVKEEKEYTLVLISAVISRTRFSTELLIRPFRDVCDKNQKESLVLDT